MVTVIRGYSWYFLAAYLPYFIKAFTGILRWQDKASLRPTRFGLTELAHAVFFLILSLAGFQATVSRMPELPGSETMASWILELPEIETTVS